VTTGAIRISEVEAQMKKTLAVLAVLAAVPLAALAQKPVTQTDAIEVTATIEAIDHSARLVTLKGPEGELESIYAPPEMKRFDELKVGDKVTFRYMESIAYKLRKPGEAASAPASGEPVVTRGTGPRPGGTIAQQKTATVTIKAIDPKVPAVTVTTADGHTASFRVEDKRNLNGVKPGDKVEITYTEAIMISVK
jgi:Cu/Ag efflux protein CusF